MRRSLRTFSVALLLAVVVAVLPLVVSASSINSKHTATASTGLFGIPASVLAVGALAVVGYLWVTKTPDPVKTRIPLNQQSIVLPGPERIHRSVLTEGNNFTETAWPGVRTLFDVFQHGAKSVGPLAPCLGWRKDGTSPYEWLTYGEVMERLSNFGSGLLQLGIKPKEYLGLYSQNRPEWVIAEQAANAYNMALVPLYDTLGEQAVRYIANDTRMRVVVCDADKIPKLVKYVEECKTIKFVIKMTKVTEEERKQYQAHGVVLEDMEHVEAMGKAARAPFNPPAPNDCATVCYTSGTTGNPKGAMLSHRNIVSNCGAAFLQLMSWDGLSFKVGEEVHISYLPLAHMFERLVPVLVFSAGSRIGFFRGDVKMLLDDIKELKPTLFPSVPRLLNRVYDKVVSGVEAKGGIAKKLFEMGLKSKLDEVRRGIVRRDSIWDKLVFKKVQAALGGRVKFLVTGAAPISGKTLNFFKAALGCCVFEGYGQTEASAGITTTIPGEPDAEHVGSVLPCNEVKLDSVPDMKYFAEENKGEVCARGPNVMLGYLNNPTQTAEAIDAQGWLHTGDIGMWLPSGALKIIDRKKAIFKLAQGEYIAPEKIENIYVQCPPVMQAFVYGNSLHAFLVAIVVADPEVFPAWVKEKCGKSGSLAQLCADADVTAAVHKCMQDMGKTNGLFSFEQVRAIALTDEPFTVENNLLTPTFKAKRPQLLEKFKATLEKLMEQVGDA